MTYDRRGRPAPKPEDAAQPATVERPAAGAAASAGQRRPRAAPVRPQPAPPAAANKTRRYIPRLLPVTAMAAALVLSIKVGAVWEHRDALPSLLSFDMEVSVGAPAVARNPLPPPMPEHQLAMGDSVVATQLASNDGKVDPFSLGKSQIELLQSLSERRKELDARERAIEQREGLLAAAEHRIETKIGELKAVRTEIESLIKKYDEQEEQQIAGLVKIYETMKPKDAARIFNELEMDVLLEVFERMKASKTAPVLADMDPVRAKDITTRIAERKKMPDIN